MAGPQLWQSIRPPGDVRDDELKRSLATARFGSEMVSQDHLGGGGGGAVAELGFNFLAHAFWPFVKGALT